MDTGTILGYASIQNGQIQFCLSDCSTPQHKTAKFQLEKLALQYKTKLQTELNEKYQRIYTFCDEKANDKLLEELNELDYSWDAPKIPTEYILDCGLNRSALLASIFSINNNALKNMPHKDAEKLLRASWQTPYKDLAENVQQVVWSMGFTCNIKRQRDSGLYEVKARLYRNISDRLYIKSIKPVTPRNMTCLLSQVRHTHT